MRECSPSFGAVELLGLTDVLASSKISIGVGAGSEATGKDRRFAKLRKTGGYIP